MTIDFDAIANISYDTGDPPSKSPIINLDTIATEAKARLKPKEGISLECEWNYVVVKKDQEIDSTRGGIVLPEFSRPPVCSGKVVAVGPGHFDPRSGVWMPVTLKIGERLIFSPWGGFQNIIDGDEYYVFQDSDIFAHIPSDHPDIDTTEIAFPSAPNV